MTVPARPKILPSPVVVPEGPAFEEIFFTSNDGLKLYARIYGGQHVDALPVVCLHGFSHNAQDFHDLAVHLGKSRKVIVPDMRGRGQSEYARDKSSYTAFHEMTDVLDLMTIVGVHQAVIIGTSRGGIIAMLMAAYRPTAIKGFVLNDIGPVIEPKGLLILSGQLNTLPKPVDWSHARQIMATANAQTLPGLTDDDWLALAKRRFKETRHGLEINYDPALAKAFADDVRKARPLWRLFAGLTVFPGLLIRGERSELLSAETAREMAKRHQDLQVIAVKNRGHVPLLNERGVVKKIEILIAKAERA